jgi:arylsulfatase A-like enzyme
LHPFDNGCIVIRDEELAPWPRTPEIVVGHLADYYAAIEFLDAQIGRILDAVESTGHLENTIVVFTSDHGLAIGSHGLFGKQILYDHSMHSPLILAGPGIPKWARREAFCYLLDIFPTLGALSGVPPPEGSEGLSFAPVLDGTRTMIRDSIFTAYGTVQRAVRDDRWELIVYPQINKSQLFDLANDPAEMRDLSGDPSRTGEVKRLTALLGEWQRRVEDTLPLASENPKPIEFDYSKLIKRAAAPGAERKTAAGAPKP